MTDVNLGVVQRPLVKVNGSALSDDNVAQLLDCHVDLAIGRPGSAELRFFDPTFDLIDSTQFDLGKTVEVQFPSSSGLEVVFKGAITGIETETLETGDSIFRVVAYDKSFSLTRKWKNKVWLKSKYSDIVSAIASECGVTAQMSATTEVYEHIAQMSDHATLLTQIATDLGLVWFFHNDKLHVVKPDVTGNAVCTLTLFENLYSLRSSTSAAAVTDAATARGWDPASKEVVQGTSDMPSRLDNTALGLGTRTQAKSHFPSERVALQRPTISAAEAKTVASALRARDQGEELTVRGKADGHAGIVPGAVIDIKGAGTKISGKYFVAEAEHIYSSSGYVVRFVVGSGSPRTLVDLLGARQATAWHHRGPVIGIVTEVGKSADNGKVKVKLPVVGDSMQTDWARVAAIGAGKNRGLFMMPSINDEVLVMFEHGDLRRPVVVGSLWNGKDKPETVVVEESGVVKEFRLTTTGKSHLILTDSAQGDGPFAQLDIDGGIKLMLAKEKVELLSAQKPLTLKSGTALLEFKDDKVTLKGQDINIEATANLNLKGTNVKVEASAGLTLKATGQAQLQGATVTVQGQGMAEVKAAMVKIN